VFDQSEDKPTAPFARAAYFLLDYKILKKCFGCIKQKNSHPVTINLKN
jgi:hypothetical protein